MSKTLTAPTIKKAISKCNKLRLEYCRQKKGVSLVQSDKDVAFFDVTEVNGESERVVVHVRSHPDFPDGILGLFWNWNEETKIIGFFTSMVKEKFGYTRYQGSTNPLDSFIHFEPIPNYKEAFQRVCFSCECHPDLSSVEQQVLYLNKVFKGMKIDEK